MTLVPDKQQEKHLLAAGGNATGQLSVWFWLYTPSGGPEAEKA